MVEDDKKNESEVKVNMELNIVPLERALISLTKRVEALEEHLRSLDHGHEQGNDIRDGGWFD
jgi:hypothetical protein